MAVVSQIFGVLRKKIENNDMHYYCSQCCVETPHVLEAHQARVDMLATCLKCGWTETPQPTPFGEEATPEEMRDAVLNNDFFYVYPEET